MSAPENVKDMKESLSSNRKADTTHVRRAFQIYTSRPCEYGDKEQKGKYVRANFRRPTGGAHHTTPTAEDFKRLRAYTRAARDHIDEMLDSMEMHLATDPDLLDVEGMKKAAYAIDTDTRPGCPVGASGLPHVAHGCASLMMAITQATDCGLLPKDPGQPWRENDKNEKTLKEAILESGHIYFEKHKTLDKPVTASSPAFTSFAIGDRVMVVDRGSFYVGRVGTVTEFGSDKCWDGKPVSGWRVEFVGEGRGMPGGDAWYKPGSLEPAALTVVLDTPEKITKALVEKRVAEGAFDVLPPPVFELPEVTFGNRVRVVIEGSVQDGMVGEIVGIHRLAPLPYEVRFDYGTTAYFKASELAHVEVEVASPVVTASAANLDVGARVRVIAPDSSFRNLVGHVERVAPELWGYLVRVDGSGSGWFSRDEFVLA